MSHTLTAKEQSLAKIFSDDYVFTIPGYQRPYAWGRDQAQELLDDLLGALAAAPAQLSDAAPYFLGSIVLIKAEAMPESTVVDGQQRLTTLTLLLSAIRATVGDAELQKDITGCIYEKGSMVRGTQARYRLLLRERDRDFFRQYVQHENGLQALAQVNTPLPDAQDRLRANAQVFVDGLAKLSQAELVRLVQFVITRCYLVTVATPDLDSAYRIFGVLNSRGLDLSATDILKAEIIGGIAPALRDAYTKKRTSAATSSATCSATSAWSTERPSPMARCSRSTSSRPSSRSNSLTRCCCRWPRPSASCVTRTTPVRTMPNRSTNTCAG